MLFRVACVTSDGVTCGAYRALPARENWEQLLDHASSTGDAINGGRRVKRHILGE